MTLPPRYENHRPTSPVPARLAIIGLACSLTSLCFGLLLLHGSGPSAILGCHRYLGGLGIGFGACALDRTRGTPYQSVAWTALVFGAIGWVIEVVVFALALHGVWSVLGWLARQLL